jgi:3-dehydroquinate dehydratase
MAAQKRTSAKAASNVRRLGTGAAVLVLHGPNLNLLGTREPAIYGHDTLRDIDARLAAQARAAGVRLLAFQSNH